MNIYFNSWRQFFFCWAVRMFYNIGCYRPETAWLWQCILRNMWTLVLPDNRCINFKHCRLQYMGGSIQFRYCYLRQVPPVERMQHCSAFTMGTCYCGEKNILFSDWGPTLRNNRRYTSVRFTVEMFHHCLALLERNLGMVYINLNCIRGDTLTFQGNWSAIVPIDNNVENKTREYKKFPLSKTLRDADTCSGRILQTFYGCFLVALHYWCLCNDEEEIFNDFTAYPLAQHTILDDRHPLCRLIAEHDIVLDVDNPLQIAYYGLCRWIADPQFMMDATYAKNTVQHYLEFYLEH